MYAAHFAAALALKARVPRASTWGLLFGVSLLDLLFGPLVLAGFERVSLTPGVSPGFSLDHIDWSHSLVMALAWSLLFGAAFVGRGRAVAAVMATAVFSHFVLDLVVHPPDLALWPGSAHHLGLGLWRAMPVGWWWLELAVIMGASAFYWRRSQADASFGGRAGWAVAFLVALHLANSPWLSVL